jgi:hypothetical protein
MKYHVVVEAVGFGLGMGNPGEPRYGPSAGTPSDLDGDTY